MYAVWVERKSSFVIALFFEFGHSIVSTEQLYLAAMRISFEFQEVREKRFALRSGEINCLAKLR